MAWRIEHNKATGGKELTDGQHSFPLSRKDLETLKSGNKAAVKKLVNEKRGTHGRAPTEEDLATVRKDAGGAAFQVTSPVKRS